MWSKLKHWILARFGARLVLSPDLERVMGRLEGKRLGTTSLRDLVLLMIDGGCFDDDVDESVLRAIRCELASSVEGLRVGH